MRWTPTASPPEMLFCSPLEPQGCRVAVHPILPLHWHKPVSGFCHSGLSIPAMLSALHSSVSSEATLLQQIVSKLYLGGGT